jgi:uncharacterized membrane protein
VKQTLWYKLLKWVGLGVLAAITASVSYYHMMHQIQTKTQEWHYFSFILPLAPDGAMLLGSLQIMAIRASSIKGWQRFRKNANAYALLFGGLIGSGWANLNSSGFASPIRIFWAVFPVFMLYLAVEGMLGNLAKARVAAQNSQNGRTRTTPAKRATPAKKATPAKRTSRAKAASDANQAEQDAIRKAEEILENLS